MSLKLKNLDDRTREAMLAEVNMDIDNDQLYLSERLSRVGKCIKDYFLKCVLTLSGR